jgi:hypothetical protein
MAIGAHECARSGDFVGDDGRRRSDRRGMRRRVQPIPGTCPLHLLLPLLRPARTLGVWVAAPPRAARPAVHRSARLILSADLGSLLVRAERVVAWDGARLRIVPVAAWPPVDHRAEPPIG